MAEKSKPGDNDANRVTSRTKHLQGDMDTRTHVCPAPRTVLQGRASTGEGTSLREGTDRAQPRGPARKWSGWDRGLQAWGLITRSGKLPRGARTQGRPTSPSSAHQGLRVLLPWESSFLILQNLFVVDCYFYASFLQSKA